ncbi:MAG: acyl-CoA dehydrogenase family protein [Pseudomonas sp.]
MLKLSQQEQDFRDEVRAFIAAHLPADIKYKVDNNLLLKKSDHVRWQKILHEKGWFAASWPEEYGGKNWSAVQQYLFDQENALAGAPFISPFGVNMVGPVVYTFGNQAQKDAYLPGILSSDTWWCQGYSEPNAGSDLASLKTPARRDGDEYVINGTKMWTTQAQYADMMHMLVRTSSAGRKQEGISFLCVDMKSPGISISPIVTIDGLHHTNQTFFDNVRVPVANLIGAEGDGWKIARFLLEHERGAIADTAAKSRALAAIRARLRLLEADGMNKDRLLQFKLRTAELDAQTLALIAMEQRYLTEWQKRSAHPAEAAALKVRGTELQQTISVLVADLHGPYKMAYDAAYIDRGEMPENRSPAQEASGGGHLYLYGRCASIYGGTNQVQRNIIAGSRLR